MKAERVRELRQQCATLTIGVIAFAFLIMNNQHRPTAALKAAIAAGIRVPFVFYAGMFATTLLAARLRGTEPELPSDLRSYLAGGVCSPRLSAFGGTTTEGRPSLKSRDAQKSDCRKILRLRLNCVVRSCVKERGGDDHIE